MAAKSYEAQDIQNLEIIEAIQLRPGMYIGSVDDDGVEVCAREILDNGIDEHMSGFGKLIEVVVDPKEGTMSFTDHARGIPVGEHPKHKGKSALEVVLTTAHSGGKFGKLYDSAGGLHGTGMKAVNALSRFLQATVWREGQLHTLNFVAGKTKGKLGSIPLPQKEAKRTGTRITFALEKSRFPDAASTVVGFAKLGTMLRQRAFLNPGLTLTLEYAGYPKATFFEKDGIAGLAAHAAGESRIFPKVASFDNEEPLPGIRVFAALAWSEGPAGSIQAFCNSVCQPEGGTHVTGLLMAVTPIIRKYIVDNKMITQKDGDLTIEGKDVLEGLHAVVAIRHASPIFKGQAKVKLTNGDAQGAVQKLINAKLPQWLEENQREARALCSKALTAARARIAAAKAKAQVRKEDQGVFGMKGFGKLSDCSSRNPEETELFIVEGDSAGGSAKDGRNRRTQAIYPLKGKPKNTWETDAVAAVQNVEISDLAAAIGTGLFLPGATEEEVEQRLAKVRYGKILCLADADIDGSHIQCLLLTHFFKHMRPLIERGLIYLGQPPLYRVEHGSKRRTYLKGEAELGAFFEERAKMANAAIGGCRKKTAAAVAAAAPAIKKAIERAASRGGFVANDVSCALGPLAAIDESAGIGEMRQFAEGIERARVSAGSQNVTFTEVVADEVFIVAGLGPDGRFFTTVVNADFYNSAADAYNDLEAILGEGLPEVLAASGFELNGKELAWDPLSMASALEAEARRGTKITRMKGLGEMNGKELGDTTLNPALRTVVQITVDDFDETGEFIGLMMSNSSVEARREVAIAHNVKGFVDA